MSWGHAPEDPGNTELFWTPFVPAFLESFFTPFFTFFEGLILLSIFGRVSDRFSARPAEAAFGIDRVQSHLRPGVAALYGAAPTDSPRSGRRCPGSDRLGCSEVAG